MEAEHVWRGGKGLVVVSLSSKCVFVGDFDCRAVRYGNSIDDEAHGKDKGVQWSERELHEYKPKTRKDHV
jgi:hypothetical protein